MVTWLLFLNRSMEMQIQQNISLKPYNTFGIDATASHFAVFQSIEELEALITYAEEKSMPILILGGGSNMLLTQDYKGLVLRNELKGIAVVREDHDTVYVRSAAGENWHEFVLYCIKNNFTGVENLSLIPGSVGASPMQNIGAYGVEIKDVFKELEAYHLLDKKLIKFSKEDCEFGYRESVFKRKYKGEFVITSVTFKLSKTPVYNTTYGAIQQELDAMGVKELSIAAISQAVINIRQSKLPDPKEIGNAGSFFKNPTIPTQQFEKLKKEFPAIVGYPVGDNEVKVAAGWLIEQCGWKGYREGDVGCHAKQALVLVNYGNAKGKEVLNLSTLIMKSVEETFGIKLEREVNII
jgi:UDP-N-acetylmuramate dehydrogenase